LVDGHPFRTRYDFDDNDNLGQVVYPSNNRVHYDYNTENQIVSLSNPETGAVYASQIEYHPAGGTTRVALGNGVTSTFSYDPTRYWVSTIDSGDVHLGYHYDTVGNVSAIDDPRAGKSWTFDYDPLDRLIYANSGGLGTSNYGYDVHGNQQLPIYTYQTNNKFRLQTVNGVTVGYDANGNMTSSGPGATYTYGARNLMDSSTVNSTTSQFTYDADSWRLKKVVGPTTFYYVRGIGGELLSEYAVTGGTTDVHNYIYAAGRLIAVSKVSAPLP
jgi:YD repeat-containing protein